MVAVVGAHFQFHGEILGEGEETAIYLSGYDDTSSPPCAPRIRTDVSHSNNNRWLRALHDYLAAKEGKLDAIPLAEALDAAATTAGDRDGRGGGRQPGGSQRKAREQVSEGESRRGVGNRSRDGARARRGGGGGGGAGVIGERDSQVRDKTAAVVCSGAADLVSFFILEAPASVHIRTSPRAG